MITVLLELHYGSRLFFDSLDCEISITHGPYNSSIGCSAKNHSRHTGCPKHFL